MTTEFSKNSDRNSGQTFHLFVQSICTHYYNFKNMGWFATLKEIGSKIWGAKNRVRIFFVIQKEKRQPGLFSFKLQIASRKKIVQTLKNRVDATFYFLKFQILKNIRYTRYFDGMPPYLLQFLFLFSFLYG